MVPMTLLLKVNMWNYSRLYDTNFNYFSYEGKNNCLVLSINNTKKNDTVKSPFLKSIANKDMRPFNGFFKNCFF